MCCVCRPPLLEALWSSCCGVSGTFSHVAQARGALSTVGLTRLRLPFAARSPLHTASLGNSHSPSGPSRAFCNIRRTSVCFCFPTGRSAPQQPEPHPVGFLIALRSANTSDLIVSGASARDAHRSADGQDVKTSAEKEVLRPVLRGETQLVLC